ncbi:MAG: ribosome maturation factor RimP [Nitrospinota bacterium]|nr:ribosome maturation factor RimP [Nitrospinota bacterium]
MIKNDLSLLIEDLVTKQGFYLVELHHSVSRDRDLLKIFVDNRGGVTLKDCEKISRFLEEEIEKNGLASDNYQLEVSSPGIDRPLKKLADFVHFQGKIVRLKMSDSYLEKTGKRNLVGTIKQVEDEEIEIELKDNSISRFLFRDILKAKLEIDWEVELEKGSELY